MTPRAETAQQPNDDDIYDGTDEGDPQNPETPTWLMVRENMTVWCGAGPFPWRDDAGLWAALTSLVVEELTHEMLSGTQRVKREYFLLYQDDVSEEMACVSYGDDMIKEIEDEFYAGLDGQTLQ